MRAVTLNTPDWTIVKMNSPVHPLPRQPNSKRVQHIPDQDQRPPEPNMPLTALTVSIVTALILTSHSLPIAIKKRKYYILRVLFTHLHTHSEFLLCA